MCQVSVWLDQRWCSISPRFPQPVPPPGFGVAPRPSTIIPRCPPAAPKNVLPHLSSRNPRWSSCSIGPNRLEPALVSQRRLPRPLLFTVNPCTVFQESAVVFLSRGSTNQNESLIPLCSHRQHLLSFTCLSCTIHCPPLAGVTGSSCLPTGPSELAHAQMFSTYIG